MPFDSTTFRQPTINMLPPTPPERGDRPLRIVINIEIVDRRAQTPQRGSYRFGTLTTVLLILGLLAALAGCAVAQAQPSSRDSYRQGPTYEHWQDTNGWHGETRREGRTTDWTSYGPRGEQKHCHQYFVGDQPYTSCN